MPAENSRDNLDFVTVARFNSTAEAQLALNRLQAEGVRGDVTDGLVVDTDWALTTALGAVKLQVPALDAARAAIVLSERFPPDELEEAARATLEPGDTVDEPEVPPNSREANAERAYKAGVIGLLFFPLELYAFWLVLKVFVSDEPLRSEFRRKAWFGALFAVPATLLMCVLLRALLSA